MTIQIISLVIALLAVIVGPIITYRITKKNLEFQFRSLTQENWLSKLEDSILSFLNNSEQWIGKYRALAEIGKRDESQITTINNKIDEMLDSINSSIIKLQLHLDIQKTYQKEILENVVVIKGIINNKSFDNDSIQQIRKAYDIIIEKSQSLFKEERQKVAKIFRWKLL